MILYFDNYITDASYKPSTGQQKVSTSFYQGGHVGLDDVRKTPAKIYQMPSKLDITLYTLASYAIISWSHVFIKYELENPTQKEKFVREVKKIFPKAYLHEGRSDSQQKFQESVKHLETIKDEWIFYAGNNDHPLIAPNLTTLHACLKKAEEKARKNPYVSIALSHFTEFYNKPREGTPFHEIYFSDTRILEEDQHTMTCLFPRGMMHSMQIVNKKLFRYWFFSADSKGALIRRSECMEPYLKEQKQIVIIPKNPLCAHFDAEVPKEGSPYQLSYDGWPVLFIPPGFFQKKIKLRFGYDDYKEGWVNCNPLKEKYSFRDAKQGTDMKIWIEDIPLFWKKRISKQDVNKNIDLIIVKEQLKKIHHYQRKPFTNKSKLYYYYYRKKMNFWAALYRVKSLRSMAKYALEHSNLIRRWYKNTKHIKH